MAHNIGWSNLDFEQVPITCYSSLGTPYLRWVDVGMPKIDQKFIESTFFLYKDAADARAGREAKGTGFFILHHYALDEQGRVAAQHLYGVTNQHVASQYPVIRVNRASSTEIFEFGPEDWEFHPDGDDVAIVSIDLPDCSVGTFNAIGTGHFVQAQPGIPDAGFGVGDDVFMVGLFVDHEGVSRNNPLARFGNVSMMPRDDSKILRQTGDGRKVPQLSFIIDMHSRSGFSGSPAFVYRTFGADLSNSGRFSPVMIESMGGDRTKHQPLYSGILEMRPLNMFALLGVHWGQFPEKYQIKKGAVNSEAIGSSDPLSMAADGSYVAGYSGMTLVVPAWKIMEVLNLPKLQQKRAQIDALTARQVSDSGPVEESVSEDSTKNPNHSEDFNSLLHAAVRGKP